MPTFPPNLPASLFSALAILVMGICLLAAAVPREPELKNYRISRRFLAAAYIFLAVIGLWVAFKKEGGPQEGQAVMAATLVVASLQALLFTFSIITLVNMQYITPRRVWGNVVPIVVMACVLFGVLFGVPRFFQPVLYLTLGLYGLQLAYCLVQFIGQYIGYRRRFDNFFSGDEHRRLFWIRSSFYAAALVGLAVGVWLLVGNPFMNVFFMAAYTLFYVYFAVKFINYSALFRRIAPVVVAPRGESGSGKECPEEHIRASVAKWVDRKGFLRPDITMEALAQELNTNQKYLSRYINTHCGQNFRTWIGSLRINESMRLIEANNDMLLDEIPERTGIPSRSTFFRHFVAVTGMTPAEYRRRVKGGGELRR